MSSARVGIVWASVHNQSPGLGLSQRLRHWPSPVSLEKGVRSGFPGECLTIAKKPKFSLSITSEELDLPWPLSEGQCVLGGLPREFTVLPGVQGQQGGVGPGGRGCVYPGECLVQGFF